jgi:hypothetical protein
MYDQYSNELGLATMDKVILVQRPSNENLANSTERDNENGQDVPEQANDEETPHIKEEDNCQDSLAQVKDEEMPYIKEEDDETPRFIPDAPGPPVHGFSNPETIPGFQFLYAEAARWKDQYAKLQASITGAATQLDVSDTEIIEECEFLRSEAARWKGRYTRLETRFRQLVKQNQRDRDAFWASGFDAGFSNARAIVFESIPGFENLPTGQLLQTSNHPTIGRLPPPIDIDEELDSVDGE